MNILIEHGLSTEKFYLGKLCKLSHGFEDSGKSLRYKTSGRCTTCAGTANPGYIAASLSEKFWFNTNKIGAEIIEGSRCWHWQGYTSNTGMQYGRMFVRGRHFSAHRLSYELHHGAIPAKASVCHRCDNPICVNPDHLFLGTPLENMLDRDAKGRQAKGEKNGGAKVTIHLVREIRAAKKSDNSLTLRQLKARFGLSVPQISRILRGTAWKE